MIDLDANATTRIDDRVLSRIVDVMKHCWGTASSDNGLGALSRKEVAQARLQVAELVDASESEIIFTSGATESINIALRGVAAARSRQGGHIITSRIEQLFASRGLIGSPFLDRRP